jgi:hypothetical protein
MKRDTKNNPFSSLTLAESLLCLQLALVGEAFDAQVLLGRVDLVEL